MKNFISKSVPIFALVSGLWASNVYADIAPGTVITAANLEQSLSQKFEGTPLGDMLTGAQKLWIKQYGLKVTLAAPKENPVPSNYVAATKSFSGQVKLNPQTLRVENYVAGMPFADVAVNDPLGGRKLMWNYYYGSILGGDSLDSTGAVMLISGSKGLEKISKAENLQYSLKGRESEPHDQSVPGGAAKKLLSFLTYPYDVAGVGAYIERADDGRADESYVYLKSLRRIRRVSGATHSDPFLGSDMLGEDNSTFDSNPLWYPAMKILGKQKILVVANGGQPSEKNKPEAYVNLSAPPYWNPSIDYKWEPREVYVVEITTPSTHPYSKKIVYMDAKWPIIWQAEAFNRAGKLWKTVMSLYFPKKQDDGEPGIMNSHIYTIDWQAAHATVITVLTSTTNRKGAKPEDYVANKIAEAVSK